MGKAIAGVAAVLILAVVLGIILTAIGKFLLGVAMVVGFFLIAGLVIAALFGSKFVSFWKSF